MTIIVASGTSTPTSTTVVPTSTSSSPSRKRVISASRSAGFSRPWTSPTRSGASSVGQPDRLGSRRRPRRRARRRRRLVPSSMSGTTTNVRWPAAASSRTLLPGRRRARPGAGSRSGSGPGPPAACAGPTRRGRRRGPGRASAGSASRSSAGRAARGRRPSPRAAPRCSTPKRCCSSMTTSAEVGERHRLLDQRVGPDHDRRLARRDRARAPCAVPSRLERAGQQRRRRCRALEQRRRRVSRCWRASRSVGASSAPWQPGPRRGGQRVGRDRGLARPDVALEQPEHRRRAGEVVADRVDRGVLVGGQLDRRGRPCAGERLDERRRGSRRRSRRRRRSVGAASRAALPAPPDHAELEREQLVEGEPPQGGVARLERRRVVGLLERLARSATSRPRAADRGRQVLRVGVPGPVERLADRRSAAGPRSARPSAGRPARSGRRGAARRRPPTTWNSGLSRVSSPAEVLELARHDDLVAGVQPPLDEAPPEPGRLDASRCRPRGAAIVRWTRRRNAGSTRTSRDA